MRAALYIRVSTDEQVKEGYSIESQLNILSAWSIVKGCEIADRYIDDGYSAKNMNRPAMKRLLADCEAGLIDAVVVWRLDRLSRSLRDIVSTVDDVFRAKNIEFISTTESIDTSSTAGRLVLNILASVAQNEREINEERVRMVSMELASMCVHMGGVPLYGYSVGEDRHYIINEAEAPAVRMAFEMRFNRCGYGEIITALTDAGYRTRKGRIFTKNVLHDMLANEKYAGVFIYNRAAPAARDGKRNSHASKSEDQIIRIPGGMPAIVSREIFDGVQLIMKADKHSGGGRAHAKRIYPASGLVYCAVCGSSMIVDAVGRNRNGTYQYSYGCRNKCVKRIRNEKLLTHIFDFLDELTADPQIIAQAAKIANDAAMLEHADIQACAEAASAQIADIDAKIASIIEFIKIAGAAAPASLAAELRALEAKKDACKYDVSLASKKAKAADADSIYQRLAAVALLRDAAPSEQRAAIQRVIHAIHVHNDAIWIDVSPPRTGERMVEATHHPLQPCPPFTFSIDRCQTNSKTRA